MKKNFDPGLFIYSEARQKKFRCELVKIQSMCGDDSADPYVIPLDLLVKIDFIVLIKL